MMENIRPIFNADQQTLLDEIYDKYLAPKPAPPRIIPR
jgi:hypothetical protein